MEPSDAPSRAAGDRRAAKAVIAVAAVALLIGVVFVGARALQSQARHTESSSAAADAVGAPLPAGEAAGADSDKTAFQDRMNSSLQALLDSVLGPGKSVVSTTAKLDPHQAPPAVETYVPHGSPDDDIGGVLGPDNIGVSEEGAASYSADQNEHTAIIRNNAADEVAKALRTAPGVIKRLQVSVRVDAGADVFGVDTAPVIEQLVSAAAGLDVSRGDSVTVVTV